MHIIARIIGGIIGLVTADRAFVYGFRLINPARGCMSGFDFIPAIPFWLLALVLGAVLGAFGGNLLLNRFWAWQARGNQSPKRQRGIRTRPR